jgi:hypothetical protein
MTPEGTSPPWHALLAPLPPETGVRREPVGSPDVRASPEGAAIAGWEQLVVELSAGLAGLRIVLVVLDASGRPILANDLVLFQVPPPNRSRQESLGGRFEDDGGFRGTHWDAEAPDQPDDASAWRMIKREPSADEVKALKALVADVVRRQQG